MATLYETSNVSFVCLALIFILFHSSPAVVACNHQITREHIAYLFAYTYLIISMLVSIFCSVQIIS